MLGGLHFVEGQAALQTVAISGKILTRLTAISVANGARSGFRPPLPMGVRGPDARRGDQHL